MARRLKGNDIGRLASYAMVLGCCFIVAVAAAEEPAESAGEAFAPVLDDSMADRIAPEGAESTPPLWGDFSAPDASPLLSPLSAEQVRVFPYVPPLSADQAVRLLRRTREQLEIAEQESPPSDVRMKQINGAIQSVLSLTRQLDRQLASVEGYDWYLLGRRRISPGEWRDVSVRPEVRARGVMALAFRSEDGRVLVEGVVVNPGGGADDVRPACGTIYLREDVPKREVCQLLAPVDISEIRVRVATDEPARPLLYFYAGIGKGEEHGKQAWSLLETALEEIGRYRFEEARQMLRDAEAALGKFAAEHGI